MGGGCLTAVNASLRQLTDIAGWSIDGTSMVAEW